MPKRKSIDPTEGKIYDPIGNVASDYKSKRKELVSELAVLLQSTMDQKVSGILFGNQIDTVGNYVFELRTYLKGLKDACNSILENYPSNDEEALNDISSLCDITTNGLDRVDQYMSEIKVFANDLQNIKSNMYTAMVSLHNEG